MIYLLLSPYDNEKVDLMHKVEKNYTRMLDSNEMLAKFLKKLLSFELMPLNEQEIEQQMSSFDAFKEETENSKAHMRDFIKQLIQHNLRVIEKYYSRIRISTLSKLIGVNEERTEAELCDMVVNKRIHAKINRLTW